ncbi:MAG: RNA polymerase sigma factor [Maribacter sp.]|nr:RNA polymerase sigma factor [Maribacter sp.]
MNTDDIIKGCIKKNRQAQEELYNSYKKKLYPVCLKYCSSHSEAEDHLHDTFIIIFDTIIKYKGKGSFEGWMKRIAINKAIDKYKKNNVYSLDDNTANTLTEDYTLEDEDLPPTLEALIALIQELPNQYRIIFNLYEIDGFSHKEISELLNISESTSKSNLHRAKAILKKKILAKKNKVDYKTDNYGR